MKGRQIETPMILKLSRSSSNVGAQWDGWNPTAPIFLNFAIIGPETFDKDSPGVLLEQYPEDGNAKEFALEKFLYADAEEIKEEKLVNSQIRQAHFCQAPKNVEDMMLLKSEADKPIFIFVIRMYCSPLTRPALRNDGSILQELEKYRDESAMPLRRFSLCFITQHPFPELYFSLLHQMLELETKARISSTNLFMPTCQGMQWPDSSVQLRDMFLLSLSEMSLPAFGELFVLNISGMKEITFRMPHLSDVSQILPLWGYCSLFSWLKCNEFLLLLSTILLETNIIVLGSSISELSHAVSLIPRLITPFVWICPVITVLPEELVDILDSPMATIVGILSKYRTFVESRNDNAVIIDLDRKLIFFPHDSIMMPDAEELRDMISPIMQMDTPAPRTFFRIVNEFLDSKFAGMIIKCILANFDHQKLGGTVFLDDLMYSMFDPKDHPFLERFIETQLFAAFSERMCRVKYQYVEGVSTEKNNNEKPSYMNWVEQNRTGVPTQNQATIFV